MWMHRANVYECTFIRVCAPSCVYVFACSLMRISPGMLQASRDDEVLEVKAGDLVHQRRLLLHSGGDASGSRPSQVHSITKTQAEGGVGLGGEAGLQAGRMVMGRESTVKSNAIFFFYYPLQYLILMCRCKHYDCVTGHDESTQPCVIQYTLSIKQRQQKNKSKQKMCVYVYEHYTKWASELSVSATHFSKILCLKYISWPYFLLVKLENRMRRAQYVALIMRLCWILDVFWCLELFLAVRTAEEVIPHYAQQLRERVRPDMITLGSLSLQQVRATKRNICVIIPYSPAHQPCPLCCVSEVWLMDTECVHVCVYLCLFLSVQMPVCVLPA